MRFLRLIAMYQAFQIDKPEKFGQNTNWWLFIYILFEISSTKGKFKGQKIYSMICSWENWIVDGDVWVELQSMKNRGRERERIESAEVHF